MVVLRSLLFALLFYANTTFWVIIGIPTLLLPYPLFMAVTVRSWARTSLWIHRVVCRVTVELRGQENIPQGAVLVAAKHQSAWETMFLTLVFPQPIYVAKRELLFVPLFGWYIWKSQQITIDRGRRAAVVGMLNRKAKAAIALGRQLLIFPEGTRRPVDAEPAYKPGVGHLYTELGVPCLPVALNVGLFWPRRTFMKYPGKVIVEFLPVIQPGLSRGAFMPVLREAIETATNRLVAEARAAGAGR